MGNQPQSPSPDSLLFLHFVFQENREKWESTKSGIFDLWNALSLDNKDQFDAALQNGANNPFSYTFAAGTRKKHPQSVDPEGPHPLVACFYIRHDVCGMALLIQAAGRTYRKSPAENAAHLLEIISNWINPTAPASKGADVWDTAALRLPPLLKPDESGEGTLSRFAIYGEWRHAPDYEGGLSDEPLLHLRPDAFTPDWNQMSFFADGEDDTVKEAVYTFLLGIGGIGDDKIRMQADHPLVAFQREVANLNWGLHWLREKRPNLEARFVEVQNLVPKTIDKTNVDAPVNTQDVLNLQTVSMALTLDGHNLKHNATSVRIAADKLSYLNPEALLKLEGRNAAVSANPFAQEREFANNLVRAYDALLQHLSLAERLWDDYAKSLTLRQSLQKESTTIFISGLTSAFFFFTAGFSFATSLAEKVVKTSNYLPFLSIPLFTGALGFAVPILGLAKSDGSGSEVFKRVFKGHNPSKIRALDRAKIVALILTLVTVLILLVSLVDIGGSYNRDARRHIANPSTGTTVQKHETLVTTPAAKNSAASLTTRFKKSVQEVDTDTETTHK